MPNIDLSILNQRQTPAFYASSLATRPAFGFAGRIFIDTDSPSTGLYRDTGAAWVQIADPGAGTTGTLQQVTTNGNTTTVGIISNTVSLPLWNTINSNSPYYFGGSAGSDNFKIFSAIGATLDQTEMVFQVGDNGQPYASGGERFRFNYDNGGGGTGAKDVFIVDYDLSYFNTSLGINTDTPTSAFDVHSGVSVIAQLNQTVATNNSLLAFQNNNAGLWRIGNFYNAGANDFGVFDVIGAIQPVTIKKTTGQVLIGTSTVGSGKLVVASATGDNGIQIVSATAPSLRIDSAESGPTKRAGLGISTATNNFIQGSADRDFCIFNGSTAAASPILFGIYGTTNVQEAARISAARNFLLGTTTDAGQRLQVSGDLAVNTGTGATFRATVDSTNRVEIGNFSAGSGYRETTLASSVIRLSTGTAGGGSATTRFTIGETGEATFSSNVSVNNLATSANYKLGASGRAYFSGLNDKGIFISDSNSPAYVSLVGLNSAISSYNNVELRASGTDGQLYLTTSGNVLINSLTDAGQKLQVNGETAFTNTGIQLNLVYSGATKTTFRCDSAGGLLVNASAGSYIINYIGGTERLRIKTNTINISNIPTSAAGLVSGDIYSNAGILTIVP